MIWHPLSLTILCLDGLALLFLLASSRTALAVLTRWKPESRGAAQVALEAGTDGASTAAGYAVSFFAAATLVLVLGIAQIFPGLVEGAMCGTGVLESMGSSGPQALLTRGLAMAALWVARTMDKVNRGIPRPPAQPLTARWQLLALPFLVLAVVETPTALAALDPYATVACCQAVYDNFSSVSEARHVFGLSDGAWVWLFAASSLALASVVLWSWRLRRRQDAPPGGGPSTWVLAAVSWTWIPVAAIALVRVLSAYHYEVLQHHCPWCLFLPRHGTVGYLLFGALGVVGLESLAYVAAGRLVAGTSGLGEVGARRQGRALVALALALVVFLALSLGPALIWRLSHGVWLHA